MIRQVLPGLPGLAGDSKPPVLGSLWTGDEQGIAVIRNQERESHQLKKKNSTPGSPLIRSPQSFIQSHDSYSVIRVFIGRVWKAGWSLGLSIQGRGRLMSEECSWLSLLWRIWWREWKPGVTTTVAVGDIRSRPDDHESERRPVRKSYKKAELWR